MSYFNDLLVTAVQRTASNLGKLRTEADRASFQNNVKADFVNLFNLYNNVLYKLILSLRSGPELDDAIELGIEGRTITTYGTATQGDGDCFWDSTNGVPQSIKGSFDVLLTQIADLQNQIDKLST